MRCRMTRINLNARVGLEMQDDTFAPNTADPSPSRRLGSAASTRARCRERAPIPSTSWPRFTRSSSARIRIRSPIPTPARSTASTDAASAMNQYKVYGGGTGGSSDSSRLAPPHFVVPQDWLKQNAGGEVGYRIIPAVRHQADGRLPVRHRRSQQRPGRQSCHQHRNGRPVVQARTPGQWQLSFDLCRPQRQSQLSDAVGKSRRSHRRWPGPTPAPTTRLP